MKERELSVRKSFELVSGAIPLVVLTLLSATAQCAQRNIPGNPSQTTAYDNAFRLLQTGHADEALTEIDTGLAAKPDDPSLNNLRGLVTAKLGRTEDAEASFRTVIRLRPHATMGYNNLAALLWQLGRRAEAVKLFRQALTEERNNFTALVGLGTTLAETREWGEAEPYLEKAWSGHPGDFQAGYELARSLRELKRNAEAQKVLTRLSPPDDSASATKFYALSAGVAEQLGDQGTATRYYSRAYELSPQSFEIYLALVRNTLRAGDKRKPQLPSAPAALSAEQHFELGLMFESGGDYSQAVSHFEQALQLQPTSQPASYNLALAYKQQGRTEAATELLERTLRQQPDAELYNLLAAIEEERGRYVEAVRHYQQAVELDPSNEQYYFDLGAEYLTHLTFGPATEAFRVGSQRFPKSPRLYVGRGLAQFALRQYADAADAFIDALEVDPASPDAFLAWNALPTFVMVAEWERIQPRLQRLAERFPGNSQALFCLGAALFRQSVASNRADRLDLAQSMLEKAVRLNPRLAAAHLELATLYAHRKQNQKAVGDFREAIRLDPDSEMAHYRLGQTYRDLNQLTLAERELDFYRKLSRNHRDRMAQTRSAIRQFVLAKPCSEAASRGESTIVK